MINGVTIKINVDKYLLSALQEDITGEDVSTNAVMREEKTGTAGLDLQRGRRYLRDWKSFGGCLNCWMKTSASKLGSKTAIR